MSAFAQVGNGLLRGYLFDQNLQRNKRQDQLMEERAKREAEQAERTAAMDGLTIRQRENELNEYEAGAELRAGKRAADKQALDDQQRTRSYGQSLMEATRQFETSGKLDGFMTHYNSMVPDGYQATNMVMDPNTGRVHVELADEGGQKWNKSFDSVAEMYERLAELSSPDSVRSAVEARRTELKALEKEKRDEDRDNRKTSRNHQNNLELERMRGDTQERLLKLREEMHAAGKTGRLISQADRGKLTLKLAEDLAEDPAYFKMSHAERIDAAKALVDSLYESGESPAAGGLDRPELKPKPQPKAAPKDGSPDGVFKSQTGLKVTPEQFQAVLQRAIAANPSADPKAVEAALRQRYGL